jgi:hypothetical protein
MADERIDASGGPGPTPTPEQPAVPPTRMQLDVSFVEGGDATATEPGVSWAVLGEEELRRLRDLGSPVIEWVRESDANAAAFAADPLGVLSRLAGGLDDQLVDALRREQQAHAREAPWGDDLQVDVRFSAAPDHGDGH